MYIFDCVVIGDWDGDVATRAARGHYSRFHLITLGLSTSSQAVHSRSSSSCNTSSSSSSSPFRLVDQHAVSLSRSVQTIVVATLLTVAAATSRRPVTSLLGRDREAKSGIAIESLPYRQTVFTSFPPQQAEVVVQPTQSRYNARWWLARCRFAATCVQHDGLVQTDDTGDRLTVQ